MSDVTALLATRDCSTVGCPNEADAPDGLCRYCRRNRPRPLRLVHSREETPVRKRNTCSVDGCSNETVSDRGRFARVCHEHKARAVRAETRFKAVPATPKPKQGPGPTAATVKLQLHDTFAKLALEALVDWAGREPDVILATARGRHAWGSIRYGDRLMYEYDDDELRANALEELADAVNYLTVLEQRIARRGE